MVNRYRTRSVPLFRDVLRQQLTVMQDTTLNASLLKYDGLFCGLHQFTEYDKSRASYGASFYLKTTDPVEVSRRREEKRIEFENGLRSKRTE